MTETQELGFYLSSGLSFLILFITLISTTILIYKERTLATILLFTGSLLSFLSRVSQFFLEIFDANGNMDNRLTIILTFNFLSVFSSLIFAAGLLIFAINYTKKQLNSI